MNPLVSRSASAVLAATALTVLLATTPASAHAPSVASGNEAPETARVLQDPTLSRAIGATLARPGEVDWYRMDLSAGDALVVEMTAPDAAGGIPARFTILGPGLGPAPGPGSGPDAGFTAPAGEAAVLAGSVGAEAALEWAPDGEPERSRHAGLGFTEYGGVRTSAPTTGTYWIAVSAAEAGATGKYVLAPGVREAFGPGDVVGYAALASFFADPWPPDSGLPGWIPVAGASGLALLGIALLVGAIALRRRRSRTAATLPQNPAG